MASHTPYLVDTATSKQLYVHGEPFLMLAAELQNSSMSSAEHMEEIWQKLADANINTILGGVSWDMIEPEEGHFNFDELDKIIKSARSHGLHLILLWFGSFKNALSTYTPSWVKTNPHRFPRAKLRKAGGVLQTSDSVSIFHPEAQKADANAFHKLMSHIREVDERHSTVLMVQVENETGILGDSRDGCAAADACFAQPVPDDLLQFLSDDWEALHGDMKQNLTMVKERSQPNSSWEAVFGKSSKTDELFMAYHYSNYVNGVAAKGKEAYPLPLYTNVWQNYAGDDAENDFPVVVGGGGAPGDYPSGGGTSNVLDIWQKFAPVLDFIAPDIYLTDYSSTCAKYRHRNQPLFIPEQRRDEYGLRRVWIAYGTFAALGAAPFGIDTLDLAGSSIARHYRLLKSVSAFILEAQSKDTENSVGFCFDEVRPDGSDPSLIVVRHWAGYEVTIERCFVFGRPGPGAGMVIHRGGGVFLLIGSGFQVRAKSVKPQATFTGILRFEEKVVSEDTGKLRTVRALNGDETRSGEFAMMPSDSPDYGGFPISVTVPGRSMIAELEMYYIEI